MTGHTADCACELCEAEALAEPPSARTLATLRAARIEVTDEAALRIAESLTSTVTVATCYRAVSVAGLTDAQTAALCWWLGARSGEGPVEA